MRRIALALVLVPACNAVLGIEDRPRRPDDAGTAADAGDAGATYRAAVLADGPILYLRLGERSGTVAKDETGRVDARYPAIGARLGVPGAIGGDDDTAVEINGGTITLASSGDFAGRAPYSAEAWVRTAAGNTGNGFVLDHASYEPREGWNLIVGADAISFERWNAGKGTFATVRALADAAWHHVAGTWDGAELRLYVDGVAVAKSPSATTLRAVAGPWSLGGQNCECPSNAFRGAIDEVAVYDKALAPERIDAHVRAAGL